MSIIEIKKQKRREIRFMLFGMILFLIILKFLYHYWIPVKFAVKEEQFKKYENIILVKEVHYTGTGWTQIGDETGYFIDKEIKDIHMIGNLPPTAKMMQNVNIFCVKLSIRENWNSDQQGKLSILI